MKSLSGSRLFEATTIAGDRHAVAGVHDALTQALRSRLIFIYPVFIGIVAFLFAVGEQSGIPFAVFTRDPLAVAKARPYFGLLSNVGVLFWCSASAICLFTGNLLKGPAQHGRRIFFLMSGLLTMLLLLDDLFQLHEAVFPGVLGIRQRYVLLVYLLTTAIYLLAYRKLILANFSIYMLAALSLFGISMAQDLFGGTSSSWNYLVEDGAKLFGIISWFIFFACLAQKEIRSCIDIKSS